MTVLHDCSDVYVDICCNTPYDAFQVNSKGYKVCGEASSVCGTITINKRKVSLSRRCEVTCFFFLFVSSFHT